MTTAELWLTLADAMPGEGPVHEILNEAAGRILDLSTWQDEGAHVVLGFPDGSVLVDYEAAYKDIHLASHAIVAGVHS